MIFVPYVEVNEKFNSKGTLNSHGGPFLFKKHIPFLI